MLTADLASKLTTEPMRAINLGATKSGMPRRVPVHLTLAKILDEWIRLVLASTSFEDVARVSKRAG
jgi:hypothetical protein